MSNKVYALYDWVGERRFPHHSFHSPYDALLFLREFFTDLSNEDYETVAQNYRVDVLGWEP